MNPQTIVVGCDFSSLGQLAVRTALALARNVNAARVHLVHVIPRSVTSVPYPMSFAPADMISLEDRHREDALKRLERVTAKDVEITREARVGVPARDLAAAAADIRADLIIVASHGYGAVERALYGSVTSALLRISKCPVLVVAHGRKAADFETVVAGVDLSDVAKRVVESAIRFTKEGGRTHLVTVYEPPVLWDHDHDGFPRIATDEDKQQFREAREAAVRALFPADVDPESVEVDALAKAPAGNALLESAELIEADLIVIGTSGHNAWHRAFLGSTAMRILTTARCPVLFVPHEGAKG